MDVRELVGRLGLDVDSAAFAIGSAVMQGLRQEMTGLQVVAAGVGGVMAATGTAIAAALGLTAREGGKLEDLQHQVGTTAENFQALSYAAKQNGLDSEELAHALTMLSRASYGASKGGKSQLEAFQALGVGIYDTNGHLKASDVLLRSVSDAYEKMPDGVKKTAIAQELFSRGGGKLVSFLNLGSVAIAQMEQRARDLGAVMSQDMVGAADALGDSMDWLMAGFKGIRNAIAEPLLVPMRQVIDSMVEWLVVNRELIKSRITTFVTYFAAAVRFLWKNAISPLVTALGFMMDHWRLFAALLGGALVAAVIVGANSISWFLALSVAAARATLLEWLPVVGPFLAIAAAIAGLLLIGEDLYVWSKGGRSLIGGVLGEFSKAMDEFLKPKPGEWFFVTWLKLALNLVNDLKNTIPNLGDDIDFLLREHFRYAPNGLPAQRPSPGLTGGPGAPPDLLALPGSPRTGPAGYLPDVLAPTIQTTINIVSPVGSSPAAVADEARSRFDAHVGAVARDIKQGAP
jgi:hypothetical protein